MSVSPPSPRRSLRLRKKGPKVDKSKNISDDEDSKHQMDENKQNERIQDEQDECDSGKNKHRKKSSSLLSSTKENLLTKKKGRFVSTELEGKIKTGNKQIKQKRQKNQQQNWEERHLYEICMAIATVLGVIIYSNTIGFANSKHVLSPGIGKNAFFPEFEKIKSKFPGQSKRFWDVIGAASVSHLESPHPPERPMVLLLVGQPGFGSTTACIANQLGGLYTKALANSDLVVAPIKCNSSEYVEIDPDVTKVKLDNQFKNGFDGESKAAVVHRFDKLPACSVLLFHSYCENENALYKDVAIILTVELDESVAIGTNYKEIDEYLERHFTKYWSLCPDLQKDKIDAMLSRVANNVVLVAQEQDMTNCPT